MTETKTLPADPEQMNDNRSKWAQHAITTFAAVTGCDEEDVLGDLLTDLMHWADRHNYDFALALFRAEMHYEAETAEIC